MCPRCGSRRIVVLFRPPRNPPLFADDYPPKKNMIPEPLTDPEFDGLAAVLKRFGGTRAMNVEQIDGFLAALVCCPDEIPASEYLREIWGDPMINEDGFAAQPVLREFLSLIDRHKTVIAHTLRSGDVFTPVLLADDRGVFRGNDWANGFLRAMNLRKDYWMELLDDDNHGGSLVPILALAHENDPDPEMRPYKKPVSPEAREKLIIGVAAGVMNIYRYFRRSRTAADLGDPTYRAITPKVGRNDPCPCGSGKKFKHCCGRITLN
jgi:uncharacterized protein